ncbi:putative mitochondrial protein [Vitis vinifera]|uniref:Putative mitochondrial protein n=1 Tax=Vitis vinifera TaxID=29760 RepID=A0A438G5G8_VITVI|nr:putative mitochondrial protein [Vitis vinifera]
MLYSLQVMDADKGSKQCEPLTLERPLSISDAFPKEDAFEAGTQLDRCFSASPSRLSGFRKVVPGKERHRREETRIKGLFLRLIFFQMRRRNCAISLKVKTEQLASLNLLSKSFKSFKTKPSTPLGASNLVTVSQGDAEFPQWEVLPRWTSDHWPIVLDANPFKWGPTPFRLRICGCNIQVSKSALVVGEENLKEMVGKSIIEEILLYFKKLYLCPPGESWRVEDRDKAPEPDGLPLQYFKIVIAKVLSGRLRGVLHETIYSTQVDEKRRSGEEGVVFKIDFGKAYDHVKWDFLDHVLEKKGLVLNGEWMRGCLSSVSYAILVNGNAKRWVKASRGLRQDDLLSPFLFTIVVDVLSIMMLRAEKRSLLEGFKVGMNRTRVSHLQFADDTFFFSKSFAEELQTLKSLLLAFGKIYGLKVNLDKSNLFGINLDQNHLSRLALLLDCKASDWPIFYLGLRLGGNPIACVF